MLALSVPLLREQYALRGAALTRRAKSRAGAHNLHWSVDGTQRLMSWRLKVTAKVRGWDIHWETSPYVCVSVCLVLHGESEGVS